MNTRLTEIACVVDRSGSMQAICDAAIRGFNEFLEAQAAVPGEARFTLVLFDHEYTVLHECTDIQKVRRLDATTYVPRGTTALLDAIGRTMDDLGARLASMQESERPEKVIIAILTDGLENASTRYTYDQIASKIKHQQEKYSWEFVFLAANQDAIATAGRISIAAADAATFEPSEEGTAAAFSMMSARVSEKRGWGQKRA